MTLTYFLLILGLLIIAGSLFTSMLRHSIGHAAEALVWGFQIFTVIVSIPVLFLPYIPHLHILLFLLIGIVVICGFKQQRNQILTRLRPSSVGLVICLFVILYVLGVFTLRFHSSPDNHGFIATISYLRDHPSLSYLESSFLQESGASIPVHLGQQTPWMVSTWNIPDSRLRFASDMILTVGRIGLPSAIAALTPLAGSAETLGSFILFTSWIGLIGIGCGFIRVIEEIKYLRFEMNARKPISAAGLSASLLFVTSCPIFTVMLLEGTATQIWTLAVSASTLGSVLKLRRTAEDQSLFGRMIFLSVGPVFLALVYPHGLIICSMILVLGFIVGVLSKAYSKSRTKHLVIPYLGCLLTIAIILTRTSRHSFLPMLRQFASGVAGAPYNIGFISWSDALFWARSSINFAEVSGPGTGFFRVPGELPNPVNLAVLFLICLGALVYTCRPLDISRATTVLGIMFVVLVSAAPYLQIVMSNLPDTNPYIYARNLTLLLTFLVPVTFAALFALWEQRPKQVKVLFGRKLATILLGVIGALQLFPFLGQIRQFQDVAPKLATSISDELANALKDSRSVFLSKNPEHGFFQLTAYGEFRYLTDNWNPRLGACYSNNQCGEAQKSLRYQVYWLGQSEDASSEISVVRIGYLSVNAPIDGPIFLRDLALMPSFSPAPPYFALVESGV